METRGHYVLIGTVVLMVVAAAFFAVLWMGQSQREFDEYDIIFTERVSGLSVGAQVRFNGIQKGEVDTLTIDPNDPSIVIARIRVDKDTPVKTDTTAELEPVGFTGLLIVQLVGGTAEAPLLKEASDERVPEITADMSGIGLFLEGSGDVLAAAERLLSDENIENISSIIANIEVMTKALADNEEAISTSLQNAEAITTDLASVTGKLSDAADGLERFLNEDAPKTVQEVDALLTDSRALVDELNSLVAENRDSVRVFADQGLGQVAPALAEARRLMRTLDYMLREIDRDPQAYFLGEQVPEYSRQEEGR